jgi:predicted PurR-regulated permease PerM
VAFDAARHYGQFALLVIAACVISAPHLGCWPFVSAMIALYFLLPLYNSLERRDLIDE